ncbi:hypothetical protein [Prochlorococcus marinus]|uniref:hypothetical protein n=1 Tax=Prochlorococcus marinus TaxID=1219 RepID=UPI0022B37AA5|nr:hypothetical protein [Prochlorococcus marinus]
MAICVLVLNNEKKAYEFWEKLQGGATQITNFQVIAPNSEKEEQSSEFIKKPSTSLPQTVKIKDVKLLNPRLSQKERQKKMSIWLMPFGFVAGLTFAKMTNLNTFSDLGLAKSSESLFGGLLGMASGWIGSFFASRSVNTFNEELKSLLKRNEQGLWLILLETPFEIEMPWTLIKEINPIEIVNLDQI